MMLASVWWKFFRSFARIIRSNKVSYVYAVWLGGIWAWPLRKYLGFRMAYGYMDSTHKAIDRRPLSFFHSEYWVLRNAELIDFLSPALKSRVQDKVRLSKHTQLSVTPASFTNYQKFYPLESKERSVVFLARLERFKNPMLYLEGVRIYNEKHASESRVTFYLVGIGEMEAEVKRFIKDHKLANVSFEGETFEPWKYLRASQIFVSLQEEENYPSQSLLEAMACGNAIIASDVGETRLLVSDDEGILIPLDAEKLAEAFAQLLNAPDRTAQLGENARQKALSQHTIERFYDYFIHLPDTLKNSR